HEEEVGVDPLARDPDGFRWRTRSQIGEGRSWLWVENGAILFKAEASAWTPSAVQVQQVWVDPPERNKGYAKRGMRDLCRLLLENVPEVCLFVRPENAIAIKVYEGIGMRPHGSCRSLIFWGKLERVMSEAGRGAEEGGGEPRFTARAGVALAMVRTRRSGAPFGREGPA